MGNVTSAGMPGAASASKQRRARLIAAFEAIDTDHSGTLEFAEVKAAFEKVGDKITDEELKKFFTVIDKDHNNSIDFEEFLDMMTAKMSDKDSREDIQKVFNLFDDDQTGKISLRNLKRVAKELGETMSDAELLEMIERADTDTDGEINFDEFYAIMTKKTFS